MLSMLSVYSIVCSSLQRRFTRSLGLGALVVICLASIAYLTYSLPAVSLRSSLRVSIPAIFIDSGTRGPERLHWKSTQRLVAFGDSWSDNGRYPIDPPPEDETVPRDARQGQVWTDWLCAAVSCIYHDNFARSSMKQSFLRELQGAVIDGNLLNSTGIAQRLSSRSSIIHDIDFADPVPDLKGQIQQWLGFEKTQYGSIRSKEAVKQQTVFTVWFSYTELWCYSGSLYAHAQVAIDKSIDTVFEQLDLLAENWTSPPKIVLLNAVDLTFLPSWRHHRTGPYGLDPLAEHQRNAVRLVEQWNFALENRAHRWNKGLIHIFNTNDWFLNQLRDDQLNRIALSHPSRNNSGLARWRSVRLSCLGPNANSSAVTQDNDSKITCSDPDSYFFWDAIHFGPSAMKMLGESIAAEITGELFLHGEENPGQR